MPFGSAEALCDLVDCRAAVDQGRHGDKFVGRMHRRADRVFDQRGFERVVGAVDHARHRMIGSDCAFAREFLQDLEPPSAGIDLKDASAVDRRRMDDQVLFDAVSADAGFERHILGRRRWGLANIGRGKNELAERDVADFAAGGHGGDSCDGRARDVSRPVKPVTNPLSALFLWARGWDRCRGNREGSVKPGRRRCCMTAIIRLGACQCKSSPNPSRTK